MDKSTGDTLGDQFTLVTLTNGRSSSSWRHTAGAWKYDRRRSYFELEGISDVTQARSAAASVWLAQFDTPWSLWLDDDMVVPIEAVDAFCQNALASDLEPDLVAACYVPKRPNSGTVCTLFQEDHTVLGMGGGYVPITGTGFGLVAIRRSLFERVALGLERVRYRQVGVLGWPFFASMIVDSPADPDGAKIHAGEDFAFCYRALAAGGRLFCDTRLRVGHRGAYTYYWEDAGAELERVDRIDLGRRPGIKLEP